MKTKKIVDQNGQFFNFGAQVNTGGIVNPRSGSGSGLDKSDGSFFRPTRIYARRFLETMYVESWVAAKFINIPVDDMFIKWRTWEGEENENKVMMEAERNMRCRSILAMAMKSGRLHGTGIVVLVTKEAPMDTPLLINRIKQGDLLAVLAFDRYDFFIETYMLDIKSPNYGQPELYKLQTKLGGQMLVHESRILRFDGITSLNSDGWESYYERDWGVSELVPAINEITNEAGLLSCITHLANEASIPVIRITGFKDSLMGEVAEDEVSSSKMGEQFNLDKTLFKTMFMDKEDEFERINVSFAGLPELIDRYAMRMAAIAGIPATRFLSQSPAGMNATGESDMRNYAMHVSALQSKMLHEPLRKLDSVLARSAGMSEAPEYNWAPLSDMSEKEMAEISKVRAEALVIPLAAGAISEDEFRHNLSELNDPVLGVYDGEFIPPIVPEIVINPEK